MFEGNGPDGRVLVGIERKTIPDLLDSLHTGRFVGLETENHEGQLGRLLKSFDYPWLLIEGVWDTDTTGRLAVPDWRGRFKPTQGAGMTEDAFTKRLLSIFLQSGLLHWHSRSAEQSARWIASTFRWFNDSEWNAHKTLQTTYKPTGLRPISRFREMVMAMPGVGLAASKALEKHYQGNLAAFLTTHPNTLADVSVVHKSGTKRLGRPRAQAIYDAIQQLNGGIR